MSKIKFTPSIELTNHFYNISKRTQNLKSKKETEIKLLRKYVHALNWKLVTYPGCQTYYVPPGGESVCIQWIPLQMDGFELQIPFGTIYHVKEFLRNKRRTKDEHKDYKVICNLFV